MIIFRKDTYEGSTIYRCKSDFAEAAYIWEQIDAMMLGYV